MTAEMNILIEGQAKAIENTEDDEIDGRTENEKNMPRRGEKHKLMKDERKKQRVFCVQKAFIFSKVNIAAKRKAASEQSDAAFLPGCSVLRESLSVLQ